MNQFESVDELRKICGYLYSIHKELYSHIIKGTPFDNVLLANGNKYVTVTNTKRNKFKIGLEKLAGAFIQNHFTIKDFCIFIIHGYIFNQKKLGLGDISSEDVTKTASAYSDSMILSDCRDRVIKMISRKEVGSYKNFIGKNATGESYLSMMIMKKLVHPVYVVDILDDVVISAIGGEQHDRILKCSKCIKKINKSF